MPKIPTYDELAVSPRGLPGARQEAPASSLFGSGDNVAQLGKGLQHAGADLAQVAVSIQERANVDQIFKVETAFKDDLIKFETEQKSKRGAAATADGGVTQQTQNWFGEAVRKHSEALTNDAQRRVFGQTAEKLRLQSLDVLSRHEANEARASLSDSTNATIVGSINRAAGNANDWTIMEAERDEIRKRVAVLAQINGYSPEVQQALTGEKLTMLHKNVIQQLVVSNPASAKVYFDKYASEIDGAQRAEIGQFASKAAAVAVGDGTADAIWKAQGPKSRTDPVKLDTMETALREQLKGNDDAIHKGIQGLRERAVAYRDQRKEEGNALEAGVNGLILQGASSQQVRRSAQFAQLSAQDPETARRIDTYLDNRDYTRVARAAANEQRADAAESRAERRRHRDALDTTLRLSDPDRLMALSRDEVVNLLPKIGAQSTALLLNKWDSFEKHPAKLIEARIDAQDFATIALQAGMRPNQPHMPEAEKDRLVRLQQRVETVIDAEQRARGNKPLLREEKQQIMQREIDNAVMVSALWNDTKRPFATLTAEEQKNAYVTVGGKQIKLIDIPPTFRLRAVEERRKQGLPTSEQQLAELWVRSSGGKQSRSGMDAAAYNAGAAVADGRLLDAANPLALPAKYLHKYVTAPLVEAAIPGPRGQGLGALLDADRRGRALRERAMRSQDDGSRKWRNAYDAETEEIENERRKRGQ